MTEIPANEGQLGLLWVYVLYFTDPFNGFVLVNIAAQAINGISGVNDHAAIFQAFGNLLN